MHAPINIHLTLTPDQIRWNGVPVTEQTLVRYLREGRDSAPIAFLIFDPGAADCTRLLHVRGLLEANYPCSRGSCGQGSRSAFLPNQAGPSGPSPHEKGAAIAGRPSIQD